MSLLRSKQLRFHVCEILVRVVIVAVIAWFGHHTFFSDANGYWKRAHEIGFDYLPYKDFLWEYPPFAAVPLIFIPLTARSLAAWDCAFVAMTITVEYTAYLLMRRARPEVMSQVSNYWRLTVVPMGAIAWFRLDFIPMLCAAIGVIAIASNRRYVAAAFIGFGTKLWPLVFGIGMVLQRRWRDAIELGLWSIALLVGWYAFSAEGFKTFIDFRQGFGFQVESIPGSLLLLDGRERLFRFGAVVVSDEGWGWVQVLLQVIFFATPLLSIAFAWRRQVNLVALLGAITCVMLLSTRLLSPQFLVWLAPFIVWLWPQVRRPGLIYGVAVWATLVTIQLYQYYLNDSTPVVLILIGRNLLLVWLAIELFRVAFKREQPTMAASPG